MPAGPGREAVNGLVAAVLTHCCISCGDRQRPAPCTRLNVLQNPAASGALRALGRLVVRLGVATAVVPAQPLELATDPQLIPS